MTDRTCHRIPPSTRGPRRGSALVEFALMAPILLLLLAGVLNYAWALRIAASVANAARIGAQYGSRSPGGTLDTAGIRQAAINSAPGVTGMTVTSTRLCQCPGAVPVACDGSCGSGKMLIYIRVTAAATSPSIFTYSGQPFSGHASVQATMRAQ